MSRLAELNRLVEVFLSAGDDENRHAFYQELLRQTRPTSDEFDYVNREVKIRRAQHARGKATGGTQATYLPLADIIAAFRDATPMSRFYANIKRAGINWQENDQDLTKAYVMACFSELAYLHLTEIELAERDRYKIFDPSLAHRDFARRRLRFDLIEVMRAVADIEIRIIETSQFVYVIGFVQAFVVVAVRGTVTLRDWAMDFEALKNHARNGFYHRGFSDEAELAMPLLRDAVGTRDPLYITGHSLGAAVASILTQTWPDQSVARTPYLFASPRFGTRAAASRLPRYSYLRPLDVVPHTPPRFFGYSDSGAITTVLPLGAKQGGGWGNAWYAASRLTVQQHYMDGIRALVGDAVGEKFPERVYIDALIAKLKDAYVAK
ncbi:lipase family protein [Tardiphaga sp. 866_E4_N2_1]|jgi:hypothetical protein|uniref:lipase family protein n=1 Tax=unclassified Tardiphaga TaxID=2631404 RepID=UPI003F26811E